MIGRAVLQADRLGLEGIQEDALRVGPGQYRAVLEVGGLSFGLLGEEEQETLLAGYFHWLKALSYPVQLLVRVLPLDLRGYLAALEQRALAQPTPALAALTRDHMTFLQGLARQRTLLERQLYVVISAGDDETVARRVGGRRAAVTSAATALAQLAARCEDVTAGLRACRLSVRRLSGVELLVLLASCWRPEDDNGQRLGSVHLAEHLAVRSDGHLERNV